MEGVEKPRKPTACVCLVQAVTPAQLGRALSLIFLLDHPQSTENCSGTLVMSTVQSVASDFEQKHSSSFYCSSVRFYKVAVMISWFFFTPPSWNFPPKSLIDAVQLQCVYKASQVPAGASPTSAPAASPGCASGICAVWVLWCPLPSLQPAPDLSCVPQECCMRPRVQH